MRKVFKFVKGKRQNSESDSHFFTSSPSTDFPPTSKYQESSNNENSTNKNQKKITSSYSFDEEIIAKSDLNKNNNGVENNIKQFKSVLHSKVKDIDRVSILSCEENKSVTCSPQLATIPPPCKPLRSLEYLNSDLFVKNEIPESNTDLIVVGSVRTRHISFTESQQSLSTKTNRHSNEDSSYNTTSKEENCAANEKNDKWGNLQNVDKQSTSASGSDWGSDKSLPLSNLTSQSSNSNKSNYKKNRPQSDSFDKHTIPEVSPRKASTRHFKRYSLDFNHSNYNWTEPSPSSSKQPYIFSNSSPIQENVSQIDIDDILENNRRINAQLESYDDALKHLEKCDLNRLHRKSMSLPRTEIKISNEFNKKDCKSLPRSLTSEDAFKDISSDCSPSQQSVWQDDKIVTKYGSINNKHHFFVRMKHMLDSKWKTIREKKNKCDNSNEMEPSNSSALRSRSHARDSQHAKNKKPQAATEISHQLEETALSIPSIKQEVLFEAVRAEDIQRNLNEVKQTLFGKKKLIEILKKQIISSQSKCSKYIQEIVQLRNLQEYVDRKFVLFQDTIEQCYQIDTRINSHLNNVEDVPVEYEALKKEVIKWRKQYESLMKKIDCMEKETAGMQSVLRSANMKFKLENESKYLESPSSSIKDADLVEVVIQSKDFPGNITSSSLVMKQNDAIMEALNITKRTIADILIDFKIHTFSFCEGSDIHEIITNLQQENLQLKLQNAQLLEKYELDLTNTHERLLGTVQTLKQGTHELNEKVTENNLLKNDMVKLLHEQAKTESDFYDMTQRIQELNKALIQCKCKSDSYKLTNEELNEQLKAAVIEKCKLTSRLTELDSELAQVKEELNASKKELPQLKCDLAAQNTSLESIKGECMKLNNLISTKDSIIESYKKQLNELQTRFDDLSKELSCEIRKRSNFNRELTILENDLKDKVAEYDLVKSKNSEIKAFYSRELTVLRSQITRLELELQTITAERNCLRDEIKAYSLLVSSKLTQSSNDQISEGNDPKINAVKFKNLITKFNSCQPFEKSVLESNLELAARNKANTELQYSSTLNCSQAFSSSLNPNYKRPNSPIKQLKSIKSLSKKGHHLNDEIKCLEYHPLSQSVPDLRISSLSVEKDYQKSVTSTNITKTDSQELISNYDNSETNAENCKDLTVKKSRSLPNITESYDTLAEIEEIAQSIHEMSSLSKAKIIALHQEQWVKNIKTIENLEVAFKKVTSQVKNNEIAPSVVNSDLQIIKSVIKSFENKLNNLEKEFSHDSRLFESFNDELKCLEEKLPIEGNVVGELEEILSDKALEKLKNEIFDLEKATQNEVFSFKNLLRDSKSLNGKNRNITPVQNVLTKNDQGNSFSRESSSYDKYQNDKTVTDHYRGKLTEAIKAAADMSNNQCDKTYLKELNILKKSKQKFH